MNSLRESKDTVHVFPLGDLVEHDTSGEPCICGPDTEAVFREDGTNGWLVTHHSLDGREAHEQENTMSTIEKLDQADSALTNLPDDSEAFTSAVNAAREAINAARAIARQESADAPQ